jgi:aerobic-type carbon monoxide dehydrogenase small subunit (CoxS/CutS family)
VNLFARKANGHEIVTVEGLAPIGGRLYPIQEAFAATHALQCGFGTLDPSRMWELAG